ncbi:hypothetical protein GUI12_04075 [Anaplasmataceae bacterium AB001_6]|nr:hypothetical protein GUI12_04075 [Anaplasmataceae bacterium AB001_6]
MTENENHLKDHSSAGKKEKLKTSYSKIFPYHSWQHFFATMAYKALFLKVSQEIMRQVRIPYPDALLTHYVLYHTLNTTPSAVVRLIDQRYIAPEKRQSVPNIIEETLKESANTAAASASIYLTVGSVLTSLMPSENASFLNIYRMLYVAVFSIMLQGVTNIVDLIFSIFSSNTQEKAKDDNNVFANFEATATKRNEEESQQQTFIKYNDNEAIQQQPSSICLQNSEYSSRDAEIPPIELDNMDGAERMLHNASLDVVRCGKRCRLQSPMPAMENTTAAAIDTQYTRTNVAERIGSIQKECDALTTKIKADAAGFTR